MIKALAWLKRKKILGRVFSLVAIIVFVFYLLWVHGLLRVELLEYTAKALTENWIVVILAASLLATPLALAAVGECMNERAGLFNIGLEGIFFLTVVIGVLGAERPTIALDAGAGAGAVIGSLAAFAITKKFAVAEKLGRLLGGFAKLVAASVGGLAVGLIWYFILPRIIPEWWSGIAGLLVGAITGALIGFRFPKLVPTFVGCLAGGVIGHYIMAIVIVGLGGGVAGLLVGAITGALIGFIFSVLAIYLRANQVVLGMGINIFAMGMLAYLLVAIWAYPGIHSVRPVFHIPKMLGYLTPVFFVAIIAAILAHIFLHRTLFGLRIRATGEKPEAVDVAGVRVDQIRILTCTVGAALCGLGGAFFALGWFGEIVKEMAVGMGFIALACVVVAGLEPLLALGIAFVFGFVRVLADWVATMPGISAVLPGAFYLMNMVPFIITLLVVTIFIRRRRFPRALGKPYVRE